MSHSSIDRSTYISNQTRSGRRGAWVVVILWLSGVFVAGTAGADPEIVLEWVRRNGESITPAADIAARSGDELELQISVIPDAAGLRQFGLGIEWDVDGQNELDRGAYSFPLSGTVLDLVASDLVLFFESSYDPGGIGVSGLVSAIRGCSNPPLCDSPSPQSEWNEFVVGTITYTVTDYINADFDDVEISFALDDVWLDAQGEDLCNEQGASDDCLILGTASVPEPAQGLLQIASLVALGWITRVRRRARR